MGNRVKKLFKELQKGGFKALQKLVSENLESEWLEYKSFNKLLPILNKKNNQKDSKQDILETVSAFANTKGGIVVFGVKEKDNKNNQYKIEENINISFDPGRLGRIILDNLEPYLSGIKSIGIPHISNPKIIYNIVFIPEGITAYQNRIDKKYYGRFGEEDKPLSDYWAKLITFKRKYPIFEIWLKLDERTRETRNKSYPAVEIFIENVSNVICEKFSVEIKGDETLKFDCIKQPYERRLVSYGVNTKTILLTSVYHFNNQLLFLPKQKTLLSHPRHNFYLTFERNTKGTLYLTIYSENPLPQNFKYSFSKEDFNNWEKGKFIKMEKISDI